MKLNDNETKAIQTLSKIFKAESVLDIMVHYYLGLGLNEIDKTIKKMPSALRDEINKRLNNVRNI